MPTLRELRRGLSDRVAPFELATTGIQGPDGTYAGVALDGGLRRIVSSDLVSIDALGVMPEAPTDALKNEWAFLLSDPPQQRRIPEAGYVGYARVDEVASGYDPAVGADAPAAYLDTERPFLALVPAGLEVEIHAIPPLRGGRSAGSHGHLNKALGVILREDTIAVPGQSGYTTLDVTASFPWATRPDLFISAQYAQTQSGVETWAIPGARLRFDADRVLLTMAASVPTGQTFPVRVLRPLRTWIKPAGGAYGESAVGLIDEADECLGDADAITLVAAFYAAEAQAALCLVGSREQAYWAAQARAFASRSVFLRDQRQRRPASGYGGYGSAWEGDTYPDRYSPYAPGGGRFGPYFR